jgi:hypothetical protein
MNLHSIQEIDTRIKEKITYDLIKNYKYLLYFSFFLVSINKDRYYILNIIKFLQNRTRKRAKRIGIPTFIC